MHSSIPSQVSFFQTLGDAYKDDEVLIAGGLLGHLDAEREPTLRALMLCEIYRQCRHFWARQHAVQTPHVVPQRLPVRVPDNGPSALVPGQLRHRSGNVAIIQNTTSRSPHATFVRQRLLDAVQQGVTSELCSIFRCQPFNLGFHLAERFETEVTSDKRRDDLELGDRFRRLQQAERADRRVTFRHGKGFMLVQQGADLVEQEADTSSYDDKEENGFLLDAYENSNLRARLWCFSYVFTSEGLFMANHGLLDSKRAGATRFFHSSYFGGDAVLCAGDISFLKGRLTSLSNLSGHFQPEPRKLVPLIQYLRERQVPLDGVRLILATDLNGDLQSLSAEAPDNLAEGYYGDPLPQRTVPDFLQSSDSAPQSAPEPQAGRRRMAVFRRP